MDDFISEMAQLHKRIEQGIASDSERLEFDLKIKTCCIDHKMLMYFIKKAAKE